MTSDLLDMLYWQGRAGPAVNSVTPQRDTHRFDCWIFLNEASVSHCVGSGFILLSAVYKACVAQGGTKDSRSGDHVKFC